MTYTDAELLEMARLVTRMPLDYVLVHRAHSSYPVQYGQPDDWLVVKPGGPCEEWPGHTADRDYSAADPLTALRNVAESEKWT